MGSNTTAVAISHEGANELRALGQTLLKEQTYIEEATTALQTVVMGLASDLGYYEEEIGECIAKIRTSQDQILEQINALVPMIDLKADAIDELADKKNKLSGDQSE